MKQEYDISVKVVKKRVERQYSPCDALYVGTVKVVEFGYNYGRSKGDDSATYESKPIAMKLNKGSYTFPTIEEAEDSAYRIVDLYIKALTATE